MHVRHSPLHKAALAGDDKLVTLALDNLANKLLVFTPPVHAARGKTTWCVQFMCGAQSKPRQNVAGACVLLPVAYAAVSRCVTPSSSALLMTGAASSAARGTSM